MTTSPNEQLQLFSYRRCPFAIRARMTLHEKNLPFTLHEENLRDKSAMLLRHHPEGKVPLLIHGEHVIYESCVITEYLDEQFPEPALMPQGPALRAQVRLWTYWTNQLFKPALDAFKYRDPNLEQAELDTRIAALDQRLAELEAQLSTNAWLVGPDLSLADIHTFPFYRQLTRCNPAFPHLDRYPTTAQWLKRIQERPSFERTMEKAAPA